MIEIAVNSCFFCYSYVIDLSLAGLIFSYPVKKL